MPNSQTNIFDGAENELEEIFKRMRRNCEEARAIFRHIDLDKLSPKKREQVSSQIHTLREMVRILRPEFGKKLTVETAKLRRALSRDEVLSLLYGLEEF
jgi:hypothetical protein